VPCKELERAFEHQVGLLVGDEMRGVGDEFERQIVDVVVEAVEKSRRMLGSSAPTRTRVGVLSRLLLYERLRMRAASGWMKWR
jgi:hypothetical protein